MRSRFADAARDPSNWVRFGLCAFPVGAALSISVAEASWVFMAAGLAALAWRRGALPRPGRTGLEAPWAAYLAVVVAVSALGVDPARSFGYLPKDFHKVWLFYLFAAALLVEPDSRTLRWMFGAYLASALLGIAQAAAFRLAPHGALAPQLDWYSPWERARGTVHAVTYGEQMTMFLCAASAFWLRPEPSVVPRWLAGASIAAASAALLLSQTRGAWIAAGAAFLVVLRVRVPWRRAAAGAVLACAVLGAALSPVSPFAAGLRLRLREFADPRMTSNATRIELWKTALEMAADRPLTGVGLNNYATRFPAYHPEPLEGKARWGSAHNIYLHQLAERGLLGLGALLWLFAAFWALAWRQELRRPSAWSLWALMLTAALIAMNLTQSAFQEAMVWMPFLFYWSLCRRRCDAADLEPQPEPEVRPTEAGVAA